MEFCGHNELLHVENHRKPTMLLSYGYVFMPALKKASLKEIGSQVFLWILVLYLSAVFGMGEGPKPLLGKAEFTIPCQWGKLYSMFLKRHLEFLFFFPCHLQNRIFGIELLSHFQSSKKKHRAIVTLGDVCLLRMQKTPRSGYQRPLLAVG